MVTRNKHDTIEMKTSEVIKSKQLLKVKRSILHIKDQHGTLHGTLFTSNQAQKNKPLIIYSHELGNNQSTGWKYARSLAKQGYTAYTYTFNHGSAGSDMTKMSIFTEEDDLNAVVNHFKKQGYKKIFLLGASQGGVVSAMTAADRKDIKGLVLFYPAFVLRDDMLKRFPNNKFPKTFDMWGMTLGREYLARLPKYNIEKEVIRYHGPVLLVHGTSDSTAPISYSERMAKTYKNARLVKIPGAGHGFYGLEAQKATKELLSFIKKNQ